MMQRIGDASNGSFVDKPSALMRLLLFFVFARRKCRIFMFLQDSFVDGDGNICYNV